MAKNKERNQWRFTEKRNIIDFEIDIIKNATWKKLQNIKCNFKDSCFLNWTRNFLSTTHKNVNEHIRDVLKSIISISFGHTSVNTMLRNKSVMFDLKILFFFLCQKRWQIIQIININWDLISIFKKSMWNIECESITLKI